VKTELFTKNCKKGLVGNIKEKEKEQNPWGVRRKGGRNL
jgi:hypothetical protein